MTLLVFIFLLIFTGPQAIAASEQPSKIRKSPAAPPPPPQAEPLANTCENSTEIHVKITEYDIPVQPHTGIPESRITKTSGLSSAVASDDDEMTGFSPGSTPSSTVNSFSDVNQDTTGGSISSPLGFSTEILCSNNQASKFAAPFSCDVTDTDQASVPDSLRQLTIPDLYDESLSLPLPDDLFDEALPEPNPESSAQSLPNSDSYAEFLTRPIPNSFQESLTTPNPDSFAQPFTLGNPESPAQPLPNRDSVAMYLALPIPESYAEFLKKVKRGADPCDSDPTNYASLPGSSSLPSDQNPQEM